MTRTRAQREAKLSELAGPAAKVKVWQTKAGHFGYSLSCRICTVTRGGVAHSRWLERGEDSRPLLDAWAAHALESHPDCGVRWQVFSPASGDR